MKVLFPRYLEDPLLAVLCGEGTLCSQPGPSGQFNKRWHHGVGSPPPPAQLLSPPTTQFPAVVQPTPQARHEQSSPSQAR